MAFYPGNRRVKDFPSMDGAILTNTKFDFFMYDKCLVHVVYKDLKNCNFKIKSSRYFSLYKNDEENEAQFVFVDGCADPPIMFVDTLINISTASEGFSLYRFSKPQTENLIYETVKTKRIIRPVYPHESFDIKNLNLSAVGIWEYHEGGIVLLGQWNKFQFIYPTKIELYSQIDKGDLISLEKVEKSNKFMLFYFITENVKCILTLNDLQKLNTNEPGLEELEFNHKLTLF